jgi:hypothetical protein
VSVGGGPVTYGTFVQRVRRHRPSNLLTVLARSSIAMTNSEYDRGPDPGLPNYVQHWTLAAIAKASIVSGNEHRERAVADRDLAEMCLAFANLEEPFVASEPGEGDLSSFLVRIAYEQFPFQASVFKDLARTQALFGEAAGEADQDVITPQFWEETLGCALTDFVGIGMFMNIGALCNDGYYDPGWLYQANFEAVRRELPRETVEPAAERFFLASPNEFRSTALRHELADRYLRRFEFNPLVVHPFVRQPDGRFIAPVPRYALARVTPGGLYYIGMEHAGVQFTEALGLTFEHYVGNQLRLLGPEVLLHDVEYQKGQKTADWIAVFPDLVVIAEAKATPLSESARHGGDRLETDLARAPGKARGQIARTADLIRDRHPALCDVPSDREIVGLVVTMEPYFQCHSNLVWQPAQTGVPTFLVAARELEHLSSLTEPADGVLLEYATDLGRRHWGLGSALQGRAFGRNPILDRAWGSYPFRERETDVA